MFFKRSLLAVFLGIYLLGCSDYLKGEKAKPQVIELSDGSFSCLNDVPGTLRDLFGGQATEAKLDGSLTCLEQALVYFKEKTKGSHGEAYSGEDFRKFFGKHFLKKDNISSPFMAEILKLKSGLIGGSPDIFTKSEITRLAQLVALLKKELKTLLPYQRIIFLKETSVKSESIEELTIRIRNSMQNLFKETQLYKTDYSFQDFKRFVIELANFIEIRDGQSSLKKIKDLLPVVETIKDIVLGEPVELAGYYDWSSALDSYIGIYDLVLRKHYLVPKNDVANSQSAKDLGEMLMKALVLIEDTHQMKKKGIIPTTQIDELIEGLVQHEFLVTPIETKTIKDSYKMFFGRMGAGKKITKPSDMDGIDRHHIKLVKRELKIWRKLQDWVDSQASDSAVDLPWYDVVKNMQQFEFDPDVAKVFSNIENSKRVIGSESKEIQEAWGDFKNQIIRDTPVHFSRLGQFLVLPNMGSATTTWGSLTRSNLAHSLTRAFMIGYSESGDVRMSQMVLQEKHLVQWYDDFQELGRKIKAFHPHNSNSGERSFMEIDLLTFSGNGDGQAGFYEINEFIALLLSAGMETIQDFRDKIDVFKDPKKSSGCASSELDIFQLPFYEEACFKRAIKSQFSIIFSNLPGMVHHLSDAKRWDLFYDEFFQGMRVSDLKGGKIEHDDIRNYVIMLHYIESLFAIYDKDKNNILDYKETVAAAPRFMRFIKKVQEIPKYVPSGDWLLEKGFVYMVKEGKKPAGWSWFKFAWDSINIVSDPEIKADRTKIAQVLRNLKQELKKK